MFALRILVDDTYQQCYSDMLSLILASPFLRLYAPEPDLSIIECDLV